MIQKIKYYHFLLISIFAFVMGVVVINVKSNTKDGGNDKYGSFIQGKINLEIETSKTELVQIEKALEQGKYDYESFLKIKTKYPFFIFRYGGLIFWSDNKYVPKYSLFKEDDSVGYIQLPIGKFIYIKKNYEDSYDIITLIPLVFEYSITNNYIQSGNNLDLLIHDGVEVNNFHNAGSYSVYTNENNFLFSLDYSNYENVNTVYVYLIFLLMTISIVALLFGVFYFANSLIGSNRFFIATMLLLLFLVLIRAAMLYCNFPHSYSEMDIFNSKYFASSEVSPSLGDLFLNILFFSFFSWFLLKNYSRFYFIKNIINAKYKYSLFVSFLLSFVGLGILIYLSHIYYEVYSNSQYTLDITQNININIFKIIGVLIFVLVCGIYFIYNHIAFRLYVIMVEGKSNLHRFLPIVLSSFIVEGVIFFIEPFYWVLIPVNLLFWLILIYFSLPKYIGTLRYSTYLYFLFTAFVCSYTGAVNLYFVNFEKNIIEKHKYAFQLLNESDLFAEHLIYESMEAISKDKFIKNRLKSLFLTKDLIEQKIHKVILPAYLEKYEVHVSVFDNEGEAFIQNAEYSNYDEAHREYAKDTFATEYKGLYFLNEKNDSPLKRYMAFKQIFEHDVLIGSVILEFVHKKNSTNSVYPELLVDKKFITPKQHNAYQYAIFDNKIIVSKGSFNYEKYFINEKINDEELYSEGINIAGFHHLGIKTADGKIVVVSTEAYLLKNILSNFSFLFFMLLICVLMFISGYIYYFQMNHVHLNYATKILVYLNIAFFLPLVIVSVSTLSIISSSYKSNQNKNYVKKAERLSVTIFNHFEKYQNDGMWESKLENDIAQLADYTDSDIDLFNKNGELIYSYHPAIYNKGLLSGYMNPEAFAGIRMKGYNEVMVSESLGKLTYNTVYIPVKSYKNGELMGILSIPFFESMQELEQQLIGILTTILNIFSVIFIVFAGLSYLASVMLTSPLKFITQKIKRTTYGENVPLDWESKDEIGLLVSEYNSMLIKLEQSKNALSKSEKESAWREMAKQVAHEIKNPLTPMKLKIQHLQRGWVERNENIEIQTEKGLQSLLDQVNILNEIASSFSAFAKMPIPKNEHFDISKVLKSTVNLYNNTHDIHVDTYIDEGQFWVDGDAQLMSAIFTNLIINAIQSTPKGRSSKVIIRLVRESGFVKIEVQDNGMGIPDSLKEKVFLANFSTKETGSGIGLAVAKRGVEHAGGKIWFKTQVNEGTTFYIEIPLVP